MKKVKEQNFAFFCSPFWFQGQFAIKKKKISLIENIYCVTFSEQPAPVVNVNKDNEIKSSVSCLRWPPKAPYKVALYTDGLWKQVELCQN